MKRLTLVRHANADWKDPRIADFERPLTRRGHGEAESMARRLLELALVPDLLVVSPAQRTQSTADIFARELELASRAVLREERLYLAHPEDILTVVHATGPRVQHLMIVGHNPGLTELARALSPRGVAQDMETAGAYTLAFKTEDWTEVANDTLTEARYETPPQRLFSLWA